MPEPRTILIAEDSATQAMKLRLLLEGKGYRAIVAANGKIALELAREESPDLVISDIVMPEMDGYAFCEAIKMDPSLRTIPVILLTSLTDMEDIVHGVNVGADYFVTKPYASEFLLSKVSLLLSGESRTESDFETEDIEISFAGKRHRFHSNYSRILSLLFSTHENAVLQNRELRHTQARMEALNEQLKSKLDELQASEERFRSLVLTIPDIVYRIGTDGNFTFINDAVQRLGYDPVELVGTHFSQLIRPSNAKKISRSEVLPDYLGKQTGREKAPKLLDERRSGDRKTAGLEVRLMTKSKELKPGLLEVIGNDTVLAEVNSAGMYGISADSQTKAFIGTVGVIRDISDRKRMENDLKESEERLQVIFDAAEAGIILVDPMDHVVVDANPAAIRMIGGEPNSIIGKPCYQNVCPQEKGQCPITDLGKRLDSSERLLRKADGTTIRILKTVTPIQLAGREHLLESFVDISKLKEAESRAVAQGALLDGINRMFQEALSGDTEEALTQVALSVSEDLTDSQFGFVGELNENGRLDIIAVSRTGWSRCDMPAERAVATLKDMELKSFWGRVLRTGESQIVNEPLVDPDSVGVPEGHPEVTSFIGVPIRSADDVVGVFALANKDGGYGYKDQRTAEALASAYAETLFRKRSELELSQHKTHLEDMVLLRTRELERSQAQLIQTEKVAALGTLTAGIAHELNNPMMGMLNFIQYCLKHTDKGDRRHDVLVDAEEETRRCIGIVRNLLTFSRTEKEEEESQKSDCLEAMKRVLRLLSYRIEKEGIQITEDFAEALPKVWGKIGGLQQVFLNVIGNAIDAVQDRERKEVRLSITSNGDAIRIQVADSGVGIDPDNLSRILDPFFTTKPVGKGTGLGLSISHSIVEEHGGEISYDSELGTGTTVTIVLPAGKDQSAGKGKSAVGGRRSAKGEGTGVTTGGME